MALFLNCTSCRTDTLRETLMLMLEISVPCETERLLWSSFWGTRTGIYKVWKACPRVHFNSVPHLIWWCIPKSFWSLNGHTCGFRLVYVTHWCDTYTLGNRTQQIDLRFNTLSVKSLSIMQNYTLLLQSFVCPYSLLYSITWMSQFVWFSIILQYHITISQFRNTFQDFILMSHNTINKFDRHTGWAPMTAWLVRWVELLNWASLWIKACQ